MKKWEMRLVTRVQPTSDFKLMCTFDNGEVKAFDVMPYLKKRGPVIAPVRKLSFFKKVFLEAGAPTWPNGYDICPDLIYMEGMAVKSKGKAA